MAEANIHAAPWSLDILRKDRLAMACLVLSVAATFLGCHALPPLEASLEHEAVTRRREWRPLDADRATAERLGREVVGAIGYEELIAIARRAGFVTTKKIKRRAQRKHGSLFAMDEAEEAALLEVFVEVYSRYAVAAGVASQVDSPLPGPGDLVGAGILVIGLFQAGEKVLDRYQSMEAQASAAKGSTTAAVPSVTTPPAVSAAPMSTTTAPPMPTTMPMADQDLWRKCQQQHETYKKTDTEAADLARRTDPFEDLLHNNKASTQQRAEFCSLLAERTKVVQRLYKERSRYIELDCDKFDWFNKGTTAAQRLARHQGELNNVDARLKNLYDLNKRFCQ